MSLQRTPLAARIHGRTLVRVLTTPTGGVLRSLMSSCACVHVLEWWQGGHDPVTLFGRHGFRPPGD